MLSHYTLDNEAKNKLFLYLSNLLNFDTTTNTLHLALKETDNFIKNFPEITNYYNQLKTTSYSLLTLDNLPVFGQKEQHVRAKEYLSLLLGLILGEPFQYQQQNDGQIIAKITPGKKDIQNSGASKNDFGWHTDDRIFKHPYRTQWIQLVGIYNTDCTPTYYAIIDKIVNLLNTQQRTILMEPRYEVRMPFSFNFKATIWSEPLAVLWTNQLEQYEVGIPTYNIRTIDPNDIDAQKALAAFKHAIEDCRQSVILTEKNLLIFNNDRVVHARGAIQSERLVLRTYIREDLHDLRQKTGQEHFIFDARFLI